MNFCNENFSLADWLIACQHRHISVCCFSSLKNKQGVSDNLINNFVYLELVIDMPVIQLFVKNQKHLICKLQNSLNQCLHRALVLILEFFP